MNNPSDIIEGIPGRRDYRDRFGRSIRPGDYFFHVHTASSTVYPCIYKVVSFVDTSAPAVIGRTPDGRVVKSWDNAFKVKAIKMDFDRVLNRVVLPKLWIKGPPPNYGEWRNVPENQHKTTTISAVERIVRLDLDV